MFFPVVLFRFRSLMGTGGHLEHHFRMSSGKFFRIVLQDPPGTPVEFCRPWADSSQCMLSCSSRILWGVSGQLAACAVLWQFAPLRGVLGRLLEITPASLDAISVQKLWFLLSISRVLHTEIPKFIGNILKCHMVPSIGYGDDVFNSLLLQWCIKVSLEPGSVVLGNMQDGILEWCPQWLPDLMGSWRMCSRTRTA